MGEAAATAAFVEVCAADDLWAGEMLDFDVGPHKVLLVNVDGEFHAYRGICPHQQVPLAEGALDGRTLVCRAHQWEFDVCTGRSINPSGEHLVRFEVRIADGKVLVANEPVDPGSR